MGELILPPGSSLSRHADEPGLSDAALRFASNDIKPQTEKAYQQVMDRFKAWCVENNCWEYPVPPATLANYLSALAVRGRKWNTIVAVYASISAAHNRSGAPNPAASPIVKSVMRGIARHIGTQTRQMKPISPDLLRAMAKHLKDEPIKRAFVLIGWTTAMRSDEIVQMRWDHVAELSEGGYLYYMPKSKTDQEGKGRHVLIPTSNDPDLDAASALTLLKNIRDHSKRSRESPYVFPGSNRGTHAHTITTIYWVKHTLRDIGVPDYKEYGTHSLRAGFATTAALAGVPDFEIMAVTGHKSRNTLDRYTRVVNTLRGATSKVIKAAESGQV